MFWRTNVLAHKCFGAQKFWRTNVLAHKCFSAQMFWRAKVLVCKCFGSQMFFHANFLARFSYCTHSISHPSDPFQRSNSSIIYLLIVIIKEFGGRMVIGKRYLSFYIIWQSSTLVSVSLLYSLLLPHMIKSLHLEYCVQNIYFSTYTKNIVCLMKY